MRYRKLIFILIAATLFVAALVLLPSIPAVRYWGEDEITRAGLDTEYKLARYERSGDPTEMRVWITDSPTEAPRRESFITLGEWSLKHQDKFVQLVESLNNEQRKEFVEIFAFTLDDSGQDDEFRRAFSKSTSPVVQDIVSRLGRSVPWSEFNAHPEKYK